MLDCTDNRAQSAEGHAGSGGCFVCSHGTRHTAEELRQALAWAAETYCYRPRPCLILAWRQSVKDTLSPHKNVPRARAGYRLANGTRGRAQSIVLSTRST
jgi:hypothetical protein